MSQSQRQPFSQTPTRAPMIRSFRVHLHGPDCGPIPTSFEQAAARLEALPMLYLEGDGSFVWARDQGAQQVFGMLYDAAGEIRYCEIQGQCTLETWRQIRTAIAGSPDPGGMQIVRLPEQELQIVQSFEQAVWKPNEPDSQ